MDRIRRLEKEIGLIKARNKRVEADKEWELSWTRRILLTIFTYLAVGFYLDAIRIPNPWSNALVPALAFMLSTWTLPFFKLFWLTFIHKK